MSLDNNRLALGEQSPSRMKVYTQEEILEAIRENDEQKRLDAERLAREGESKPKIPGVKPEEPRVIVPIDITDPENYIILEGRNHGSYFYEDSLIAMHRLGLNPEVDKAGKEMNLSLVNTAKEADGTDYIGNINWFNALSLACRLGRSVPTIRQGIDFKEHLEKGIADTKYKVLNGNGKKLDSKILENVYDEMFKARNPWRGEWLDADFKLQEINGQNVLHMLYGHELKNGVLVPSKTEKLESCLMGEDCYIDPSSFNGQGLPTRKKDNSGFYFWYPRSDNNSVARFDARSVRAFLFCIGDPSNRNTSLGVRFVARKMEGIK